MLRDQVLRGSCLVSDLVRPRTLYLLTPQGLATWDRNHPGHFFFCEIQCCCFVIVHRDYRIYLKGFPIVNKCWEEQGVSTPGSPEVREVPISISTLLLEQGCPVITFLEAGGVVGVLAGEVLPQCRSSVSAVGRGRVCQAGRQVGWRWWCLQLQRQQVSVRLLWSPLGFFGCHPQTCCSIFLAQAVCYMFGLCWEGLVESSVGEFERCRSQLLDLVGAVILASPVLQCVALQWIPLCWQSRH
jgi:hypothetical protein